MKKDFQEHFPLLKKYDRRGPRYTSYPASPYFQEDFSDKHWREALHTLSGKALSLYIHIPYCRSLCWYCGCHMQVNRKPEAMQSYLNHLKAEIRQKLRQLHSPGPVKQIHFGGGSPNMLLPEQLGGLMLFLKEVFAITEDAEISIETDPRLLDEDFVQALRIHGFNRVSMGIQDFNAEVQRAINRWQPFELVAEKVALLKSAGLTAINMDVMYGLPHQTPEAFFETVNQVLHLAPQRIALFNYAHLPGLKPHMKLIDATQIPDAVRKLQLFWLAKRRFEEDGYEFIGMDHFARRDDPLAQAARTGELHRNFQGYTTHAGLQMLGFGSSSISFLNHCYTQNQTLTKDYETCLNQGRDPIAKGMLLNQDDRFRAAIIQRLFCQNTIEIGSIEAEGGEAFDRLFPRARDQLESMAEDGLLIPAEDGWRTTEIGQVLLRNIAMVFDAYLEKKYSGIGPTYSKTL